MLSLTIHFIASTGLKSILEVERAKTIEHMLKEYANKIGVPEKTIGKEIIFIYCGRILEAKSKENIGSFLRNNSFITVFDKANMIYLRILFNASIGLKTHLKVERTKNFEDMFKDYSNEIGLSKESINKDIIFLYNGKKLDTNSKLTAGDILRNKSSINVLFPSNQKYFTILFNPSTTRSKTIMIVEKTKAIKDMLKQYINKFGIPEETIGKEIIFTYDGKKIYTNSEETIGSYFKNESNIYVFDSGNLIGKLFKH